MRSILKWRGGPPGWGVRTQKPAVLTDLGVQCRRHRRGWCWHGPGSKCPDSTTSTCRSGRSTRWNPGNGLCSIPLYPLWGWHCTQGMSSCLSTSRRYCTTLKLYNDHDMTRSERLGKNHPLRLEWDLIRCHKLLDVNITNGSQGAFLWLSCFYSCFCAICSPHKSEYLWKVIISFPELQWERIQTPYHGHQSLYDLALPTHIIYLWLHNKFPQNPVAWNNIYYLKVSVDTESKRSFLGSLLQDSSKLHSSCWIGLLSSQGLTGEDPLWISFTR